MGWYADDVNLSTLAKNIQNRSAGWAMAAKRGSNIKIPGRPGSIHIDKPEDENILNFDMWARGANDDGTMPASSALEALCVDQLDQLGTIFGKGGLIELVRADPSVAYGRTNMVPNPSLEKSGGEQITRENTINNPSAEFSSGKRPMRRNFAVNPGMEDGQRKGTVRTNFVVNPRFAAEGAVTVRRTNLLPNPSFEATLRPWGANGNCVLTRTKFALSSAAWPTSGRWSGKIVASAIGTCQINSGPVRVAAAVNYTVQFRGLNRSPGLRAVLIAVKWRNKAGAVLSTSTSSSTNLAVDTNSLVNATFTSPAGAYQAIVQIRFTSTAVNDSWYVDSLCFETGSTVQPFFDGDSDEIDMYRYRWQDEAGTSRSEAYTVASVGWRTTNDNSNRVFGLTTAQSKRGAMSMRVGVVGSTVAGQLLCQQTVRKGCDIEPGTIISGRISVRQGDAISATRTVTLVARCYDADGNSLGLAYNAGTTTPMTAVTGALGQADWTEVQAENLQVRPKTAKVTLEVATGETWSDADYAYFDEAIVEDTAVAGPWFDGSIKNDDVFSYEWLDDAHDSASIIIGATITDWDVSEGYGYRVTGGRLGDFCMRVEAFRNPASALRPRAFSTPLDIRDARSHTLSAYVRPSRTVSMAVAYSLDDGATWTVVGAASATASVWTRLNSGAIAIPAGTLAEDVRIGVQYNAAGADGDFFDVESILFEPVGDLRAYFDGNTGKNYDWAGDNEYESVSRQLDYLPDGWLGSGTSYPLVSRQSGGNGGSYEVQAVASQAGTLGVTFGQQGIDRTLSYAFGIDVRQTGSLVFRYGIDWFDKAGALISSSFSSSTPAVNTWTRVAHTAAPPAGATVAAPWVEAQGAASGAMVEFDQAIFGFGSITTYADGSSGGGWKWSGKANESDSFQFTAVPYLWRGEGGTFVQDAGYVSDRTLGGLYSVTAVTGPWRMYALNNGEGSLRYFRAGKPYMFSVDVRATDAAQVQVQLVPFKWTGHGWDVSTSPTISGTATNMSAGSTQRLSVVGTPGSTGDATHFLPMIKVGLITTGGTPTVGTRVRIDSAMLEPNGTVNDLTYLDGAQSFWKKWVGDKDASYSRIAGPARRTWVEVFSAIDSTSFNRSLARFSVEMVVPGVYWEDTVTLDKTYAIGDPGSVLTIDDWYGCGAPTNDALITLYGPFNDLKITDTESGDWWEIDGKFRDNQLVIISNETWEVKSKSGTSLMEDVSYNGIFLLPLTPNPDERAPRLRFNAKAIGKGARIQIVGRRRYRVA